MSRAANFEVLAGARAAAHLRANGLAARDVACVPAAAGGPKGLALIPLDKLLFGGWFAGVQRQRPLQLIGSSVGAWRMAAAAQLRPSEALQRLADYYTGQRYGRRPTPRQVSDVMRALVRVILLGPRLEARDDVSLAVVTSRGRGRLARDHSRAAFARAAIDNLRDRALLAQHLERVVFQMAPMPWLQPPHDAFGTVQVPLDIYNVVDALRASGSIPIVCEPVDSPSGAPRGAYWDGGMIDYHLLLPYNRIDGIVLYPHFVPYVTPGWLDKQLPWRNRPRRHPWLENVLLICPSRRFLTRLPNGKLPDRTDFRRYGADDTARMQAWRRAISECERFAEEAMAWIERPDVSMIREL
ncbi:MAG TPA: patatin-like phospholipase family protein [Burkholderiaceae bacterium]|nr:patatin-like phospholipase family protein [Burkholderiaceae bacterium]